MKSGNYLAIMMGAGLIPTDALESFTNKYKRETKECLTCEKEHTHNNSFCSVECCKAFSLEPNQDNKGVSDD